MPLQKLTYRAGINREGTDYSNEGGFYDGNKVRFRSGQAEKIGGWIQVDSDQYLGYAKSIWSWSDEDGISPYLSVGTNIKYYIFFGGAYYDITPIYRTSGTALAAPFNLPANPLATSAGLPTVTITDANYSPTVGDYVIITTTAAVGGLTISGEYIVTAVPSLTTYQITASANATSTATGGGTVTIQYEYPTGSATSVPGLGWGAGPYSPTVPFSLVANPFDPTAGSSTITVTQAAHGLSNGNYVAYVGPASNSPPYSIPAFSGIPARAFNGTFVVSNVATNTYDINLPEEPAGSFSVGQTYTIATAGTTSFTAIGAANNTPGTVFTATGRGSGTGTAFITATSGTAGGGSNVVAFPQFGSRGWGTAASSGVAGSIRLWSNDNYGSDLVIAPRGGPIYYWKDSTGVSVRARSLSSIANTTTAGATNASFGSGVTTITVADTSSIFAYSYISGTNIAAGTYVTSAYIPGSTSVPISTATSGVSDTNLYTFSFSGAYLPVATNQVLTSSIQQFIIALGSNSYLQSNPSTTFNPMIVRWSDQANQYQWVPQTTNQSGEFTLTNGSYIVCGQTTRQENLIWTDSCLYSMQYVGYPFVWSFQVLMDNISIMSPNAAVTVNNVTYWMGREKFYVYTGVVSTLPCSLRQYVFDDINTDQAFQVFSGSNEAYNEVWWFYCSKNSNTIDKYVIYNYLDKVWYYGTMARTAWLQYGINQYPVAADYNSRLLFHEVGCDDVATATALPIEAYIQSSDFGIEAGEHLGFVWRMLPDVNFNSSTVNSPSVTMTLYGRQNSGSAQYPSNIDTVTSAQNYTTVSQYIIPKFTGQVYTRIRARQLAFEVRSTDLGVSWQLGVVRLDVKPDGRR